MIPSAGRNSTPSAPGVSSHSAVASTSLTARDSMVSFSPAAKVYSTSTSLVCRTSSSPNARAYRVSISPATRSSTASTSPVARAFSSPTATVSISQTARASTSPAARASTSLTARASKASISPVVRASTSPAASPSTASISPAAKSSTTSTSPVAIASTTRIPISWSGKDFSRLGKFLSKLNDDKSPESYKVSISQTARASTSPAARASTSPATRASTSLTARAFKASISPVARASKPSISPVARASTSPASSPSTASISPAAKASTTSTSPVVIASTTRIPISWSGKDLSRLGKFLSKLNDDESPESYTVSISQTARASTSPAARASTSPAARASTSPAAIASTSPATRASTSLTTRAFNASISPVARASTSPASSPSTASISPAAKASTTSTSPVAIASTTRIPISWSGKDSSRLGKFLSKLNDDKSPEPYTVSTSPAARASTSPAARASTSPAARASTSLTARAFNASISPVAKASTSPDASPFTASISPAAKSSTTSTSPVAIASTTRIPISWSGKDLSRLGKFLSKLNDDKSPESYRGNLTKEFGRSVSSENLNGKSNCASRNRTYTPRKSASLPSTPQSSCLETKRIAVPFGVDFSVFPNICESCLSKIFGDSYRRVLASPTTVASNTPPNTSFISQSVTPSSPRASRVFISPDVGEFASSVVRTSFSKAKRVHDSSAKRVYDSPTKRLHDSPAEEISAKPESQFVIKFPHCILPSASLNEDNSNVISAKPESQFVIKFPHCILPSASLNKDNSNVTYPQYGTENISENNVATSQSISIIPNDSDFYRTSENREEQTETRIDSHHSEITFQDKNIFQDASLNNVEDLCGGTSKTLIDTTSLSSETHSFYLKDFDSAGCSRILSNSHASFSPGYDTVEDSGYFNNTKAAKGSNPISAVYPFVIPKKLFQPIEDADQFTPHYDRKTLNCPYDSIPVIQTNFSESSSRNQVATFRKPISYSGAIVPNLSIGEVANCCDGSCSQHKTGYITENKIISSPPTSNLVGNYESTTSPLKGTTFNIMQASDGMTKGNEPGRFQVSKYAAKTEYDPHASIKYPEDIIAPSTSLVKNRSIDYRSQREAESLTKSEIYAFHPTSSLSENRKAPIGKPVDEALDEVQTSTHQNVRNKFECSELAEYAASKARKYK